MASESEQTQAMESSNQPPASSPPRENMITTAVNFLQNSKVRESTFPQRRSFLEKKGLTKEEIDIAIQRSGTADDEHAPPAVGAPPPAITSVSHGQMVPFQQPVSTWNRVRDYMATAIVAGGVAYAVYLFYKKYIEPIWFGPSNEEKQLAAIKSSVDDLQKNISETLDSIKELQEIVNKQQGNIEEVVKTNAAQRGSTEMMKMQEGHQSNEIKEEIKSLKGLLLNRKQFPAAPKTTPIIPSWQLEAQKADSSAAASPESAPDVAAAEVPSNSAETSEVTAHGKPNADSEVPAMTDESIHASPVVNGHEETDPASVETGSSTQSTQGKTELASEQLGNEA